MTKKYIVIDCKNMLSIMDEEDPRLNTKEYELVDRLLSKNKNSTIYYSLKNRYKVYPDWSVKKLN